MRKISALFAILLAASATYAANFVSDAILKDTIDITIADCGTLDVMSDDDTTSYFRLTGCDTDSAYEVDLRIVTDTLVAGSYPVSYWRNSFISIYGTSTKSIDVSRALGDLVVTIDNTTNPYRVLNFKVSFVGTDTVAYNLDLTFNEPYAATTIDLTADSTTINHYSYYGGIAEITCYCGDYEFFTMINCESTAELEGTRDLTWMTFITDTATETSYDFYRGSITFTKNGSSFYVTAQVLTYQDILFKVNSKTATATENTKTTVTYTIYTDCNSIIINGADGEYAAIYDISGGTIASETIGSDNASFAVANGIYIIYINGVATKVVVR